MFGMASEMESPKIEDYMGTMAFTERPDLDVLALNDWENKHLGN